MNKTLLINLRGIFWLYWRTSRPRFWMYLMGPWVVGFLITATRPLDLTTSSLFWLGLLVFSLPANLFLYGVNDLADEDTDQFNLKKSSYEHRLDHWREAKILTIGVFVSLFLMIGYSFLLPTASAMIMGVFLMLAAGYSLPPLRFKARPIIDAGSNILYFLPTFSAASINALGLIPDWLFWSAVLATLCWTAGMHLFSAIPDMTADKKAGLATTAVWLGHEKSLLIVTVCWAITSLIAILTLGFIATPVLFYPVFSGLARRYELSVAYYYKYFPYINAVIGFYLYWLIFTQKFPVEELWRDTKILLQLGY